MPSGTTDETYLANLAMALAEAFQRFTPDVIYYNAGTDILVDDPLNGGVEVSLAGVAARDQMVFEAALNRDIPIVMCLSGGYAAASAQSVWESLINLCNGGNVQLLDRQPFVIEPNLAAGGDGGD